MRYVVALSADVRNKLKAMWPSIWPSVVVPFWAQGCAPLGLGPLPMRAFDFVFALQVSAASDACLIGQSGEGPTLGFSASMRSRGAMATPDTWICVLPCAVCAADAQLGPRSAAARAGQPYGPPHKDNFLLQHYHLLVLCGAARRTNLLLATLVGINAHMTRNALPSKSCRPCIKEKVVDTHFSSHQGRLGNPPR